LKKYNQITTELTFRCNSKCPACRRHTRDLSIDLNDSKYTITLDNFKKLFYPEFLEQTEFIMLNGNYGDSIMNREFREILTYIKTCGTRIKIHTNGGIHSADYWKDIGNILTEKDKITFDLDGLEDTHHLYRINTDFNTVLNNARAVISTKRPKVIWKMIAFDYNTHQIDTARMLAEQHGFYMFEVAATNRSFHPATSGQYVHPKRKEQNLTVADKKIICSWADNNKWYVAPDGLVFRCCWTGGNYYDLNTRGFTYPPEFEAKFNGFHQPLEKILEYNYWNKLSMFLQGYDRSFSLCKNQCGKIQSAATFTKETFV